MSKLVLKSYAKLNLYLDVVNKRKDNYHSIITLFERISLYDTIILSSRSDPAIHISCKTKGMPLDHTNLAYKSAKILQNTFGIQKGVHITLIKKIPLASGMAGGSSNAATVLKGLNRLWKLNLSGSELARLAGRVGSDVPFFIYDTPFALGKGRGERITPVSQLNGVRLWHVVVVPRISVATERIYAGWDKARNDMTFRLTRPVSDVKILVSAIRENNLSGLERGLYNSLEAVTTRLYPQVEKVKRILKNSGIRAQLMSGSGPTVFGVCGSRKEAVTFSNALRKKRLGRVFLVSTQ